MMLSFMSSPDTCRCLKLRKCGKLVMNFFNPVLVILKSPPILIESSFLLEPTSASTPLSLIFLQFSISKYFNWLHLVRMSTRTASSTWKQPQTSSDCNVEQQLSKTSRIYFPIGYYNLDVMINCIWNEGIIIIIKKN